MVFLRTRKNFLSTIGVALFLSSCSHLPKKPAPTSSFPPYWLKVSLYAGQYFDDDKKILIDTRPFREIRDAKTLDGFTIFPKPSSHIIPAGTLLKIVKIDYPNKATRYKRPLFSPRDSILIHFKVAKERGKVSIYRDKTHIMIVPKKIRTFREVQNFLGPLMGKKDINPWLLTLHSKIRKNIWLKIPMVGMSKKEIIAALGNANKIIFKKINPALKEEAWHYENYFLLFRDDKVYSIQRVGT